MTPKSKRIVRAGVSGVLVQAVLLAVVLVRNSDDASWLIWNVNLAQLLVWVPQPVLLTNVGLALGAATYAAAIYFALRALDARRARCADPSVGATSGPTRAR